MTTTEDDFLEWDKGGAAKHVKKPNRQGSKRPIGGGARARLRAASRTPESVVKVISYGSNTKAVKQLMDYISRKGALEVETKDGRILRQREGDDGTMEEVERWSVSFRDRKAARNAMHLQVSAPPGTDAEAFTWAARIFASRAFGDGYDYAFAAHTEEAHPHVHIIVVRDGENAPNLGWNKEDSQRFRELMAEAAGEQGIVMNATPRYMRGVGEKSEKMAVRKAREREGTSQVDERAAAEVLAELRGAGGGDRPWMPTMMARAGEERRSYEDLAAAFEQIGAELGEDEAGMMTGAARMVRRQSMALRQIVTRADQMRRIVERDRLDRREDQVKAAKTLAKAYRTELAKTRSREKRIAPATTMAVQKKLNAFDEQYGRRIDQLAGQGRVEAQRLRQTLDDMREQGRDREQDRDFEA